MKVDLTDREREFFMRLAVVEHAKKHQDLHTAIKGQVDLIEFEFSCAEYMALAKKVMPEASSSLEADILAELAERKREEHSPTDPRLN